MKRLLLALLSISIAQPALAMRKPTQPQKAAAPKPNISIDALQKAIRQNDVTAVRQYIAAKGDVNVILPNGLSAIQHAARLPEDESTIYFLLKAAGAIYPRKPEPKPKVEYDYAYAYEYMDKQEWADLEDAANAEDHRSYGSD